MVTSIGIDNTPIPKDGFVRDTSNGVVAVANPNQELLHQLIYMRRSMKEMRSEMKKENLELKAIEVMSQEHRALLEIKFAPNNVRAVIKGDDKVDRILARHERNMELND